MRDITLMPNDYIVTHIKTDTICEHFNDGDIVYIVEEKVVPLVRCKECRWLDQGENESCSWSICTRHFGQHIDVNADDYCSHGEREGE